MPRNLAPWPIQRVNLSAPLVFPPIQFDDPTANVQSPGGISNAKPAHGSSAGTQRPGRIKIAQPGPQSCALPGHLAPSPSVYAVERLGRFASFASHRRSPLIRTVKSLELSEAIHGVIQVVRFVLLLVAHDTCPFLSPSKDFSGAGPMVPVRTLTAPRGLRFDPRLRYATVVPLTALAMRFAATRTVPTTCTFRKNSKPKGARVTCHWMCEPTQLAQT